MRIPVLTPEEIEVELRRTLAERLGETRTEELADEIRSTAQAVALVLSEPLDLHDIDPDFVRPLT